MNDLISRQAVLDMVYPYGVSGDGPEGFCVEVEDIQSLPSVQPETSRIENALHGKSAEEQYDFLQWLMQDYGMQFTDTRVAVIEWLKGECNG